MSLGRRVSGEEGNALVEFSYLAVLLMVPLVYVLLAAFSVQRAAFGVTEAARQAGRAYAVAPDVGTGQQRAEAASALALADQGITDAPAPVIECDECLAPGSSVRVTVAMTVTLPGLSDIFPGHPGIPVKASHLAVVDTFQAAP